MPTIEIDGQQFEVEDGKMVIQVADENGIRIPRFCYHKKLSVAANCRMCLVEVEKARKPMPACATPVMDGMKVFTKSPTALAAQKNVMEFLLINHPLDCPICDQGGECELQDVSMGYGEDQSFYSEGKRSVEDEDLGSLIATEMTRCIHCTRCVRFGDEVAGLRELGGTWRGENMKIGTYVKQAMKSEVSGNIIDLCPVGALTSKPYRFTARSWELQQKQSIAPHDCLGSNINIHVRRQQVMRVVPEECEAINESWLSDRDRFAYTGLYQNRLTHPMIKRGGSWQTVDWQTALTAAVDSIKKLLGDNGPQAFAGLTANYSTTEEYYLFQKLLRGLGINNIDHRVTQQDFRDQTNCQSFWGTDLPYADFSKQKAVLLVGSDIHREQPLAGVRLRQAQQAGGKLFAISAYQSKSALAFDHTTLLHPNLFSQQLAAILKAILAQTKQNPADSKLTALLKDVTVNADAETVASRLLADPETLIVLGISVEAHPDAATLRALAKAISDASQSKLAVMSHGPNQAGAMLAGVLPHRSIDGKAQSGLNAWQLATEAAKGYLLLHLEPEQDSLNSGQFVQTLKAAESVIAISAYDSPTLREYADIILPAAAFAETSGTFVNFAGTLQSFHGAAKPVAEARPAWKILRVMGNLFDLDGFEFCSSQEVLAELQDQLAAVKANVYQAGWLPSQLQNDSSMIVRVGHWGIYTGDPLQRRAEPLQSAACIEPLEIVVSPNVAKHYNLRNGKEAAALQNKFEMSASVVIDAELPENCVYLPTGFAETSGLGAIYDKIDLK